MNYPNFFEPKNSLRLFDLQKELNFFLDLYSKNKFPKVLLLTGNKGSGKSTLINHLLFSIFDEKNYDKSKNSLLKNSLFHKQFKENIFPNIIYLKGSDFKSVKIEDVRHLKKTIFKSSILETNRFIVFDDIELFNTNSINALLKIIEEPSNKNFFLLINNKSKPLLETIKSRALEIKIILKEQQRLNIINKLIDSNKIIPKLRTVESQLTPGNFIKYDHIFKEHDLSIEGDFIENFSLLLNLYKKNKDIIFINIAVYITDIYFKNLKTNKIFKDDNLYEIKDFIHDNLNKFMLYNINQNSLINSINNKLNYE